VVVEPGALLELVGTFQPEVYSDGLGIGGTDHRTESTVTVEPHGEVGLVLTVTALPCSDRVNGPLQLGAVAVVTRTLGITTTQYETFDDPTLLIPGPGANHTCADAPT
jgi:hypothetical protein